jgi:hypothetical protein
VEVARGLREHVSRTTSSRCHEEATERLKTSGALPPKGISPRGKLRRTLLGLVAICGAIGGSYSGYDYWTNGRFLESTDDAYVSEKVEDESCHTIRALTWPRRGQRADQGGAQFDSKPSHTEGADAPGAPTRRRRLLHLASRALTTPGSLLPPPATTACCIDIESLAGNVCSCASPSSRGDGVSRPSVGSMLFVLVIVVSC